MYSNTLVHLECWRQDYSLGSMGTVVDLSNGNTYLAILLGWCISGAPHIFDSKTCTRVKLIRVMRHVWLMVNLMCTRDEFAHVVHV